MKVRIGTRGSELALIQTRAVISKLKSVSPDIETEVKIIKTAGDKSRKITGEGVFVKEINRTVLEGEADVGVHSLKDLPTSLPEQLTLSCVPERLDPSDVLVTKNGDELEDLPSESIIGTGSPRRIAEISCIRDDLNFKKIRGNVDTRIRKVEEGKYDGLITSSAALQRLGLEDKTSQKFDCRKVVPAGGQGALGIVCREGEAQKYLLPEIDDEEKHIEAASERAFLRELGLGCRSGAGVISKHDGKQITLYGVVNNERGRKTIELSGEDPSKLGIKAARELKK